jgi:hypothetical protein
MVRMPILHCDTNLLAETHWIRKVPSIADLVVGSKVSPEVVELIAGTVQRH